MPSEGRLPSRQADREARPQGQPDQVGERSQRRLPQARRTRVARDHKYLIYGKASARRDRRPRRAELTFLPALPRFFVGRKPLQQQQEWSLIPLGRRRPYRGWRRAPPPHDCAAEIIAFFVGPSESGGATRLAQLIPEITAASTPGPFWQPAPASSNPGTGDLTAGRHWPHAAP